MATDQSVHTEVTAERWHLIDDGARFSLDVDSHSSAHEPRVFTTFIAVPGNEFDYSIAFLPEHLHRVRTSATAGGLISIEQLPSASLWKKAIAASLGNYRRKQPGIALIRIVIGAKHAALYIEPYVPAWRAPITLITVPRCRSTPYWKRTTAEASVSARRSAQVAGGDEALLYDTGGRIREGAWSNIFWFDRSGALCTPGRDLLPGIVRQAILGVTNCRLTESTLEEFTANAAEVFVTQSTTGITAVRAVDGRVLSECDVRTPLIRKEFARLREANLTRLKVELGGQ